MKSTGPARLAKKMHSVELIDEGTLQSIDLVAAAAKASSLGVLGMPSRKFIWDAVLLWMVRPTNE